MDYIDSLWNWVTKATSDRGMYDTMINISAVIFLGAFIYYNTVGRTSEGNSNSQNNLNRGNSRGINPTQGGRPGQPGRGNTNNPFGGSSNVERPNPFNRGNEGGQSNPFKGEGNREERPNPFTRD